MRWSVLKKLLMAEVLAYLAFMTLALVADWGQIYQGFALSDYLRFEVIEFSALGLFQLLLITWVFIRAPAGAGEKDGNDVQRIIKSGEHQKLEFKTSFRWDAKRGQVNKELEKAIMKTVAAFLNSDGGHLVIGVGDQGQSVGLEGDFASLPKRDADGFENHFNNLFNQMIGPEFRRLVKLNFHNLEEKNICLIKVRPSRKPCYLKSGENEDFYIRTGNVTTPLKMSEVSAYLAAWRRK